MRTSPRSASDRTLGDALVDAQAQILALDVLRWDADFLSEVECSAAFGSDGFAFSFGDGAFQHLAIHIEADRFDVAVLFAPEKIAGAAQFQIERGDAEAGAEIAEFLQRGESLARDGRESSARRHEQIGVGALVRAANAAAKLVELGKAHAIRAIDDDCVRARDVEAILDDGGRDENVRFAANEFEHHLFEFVLAHLAMPHHDARFGDQPLDHRGDRSDGLDAIVQEKHLPAAAQFFLDDALDQSFAERRDGGLNGEAVFRRRFDHAHVAQADERHVQRAWNGRRGHGQHVHILAHFFQAFFVRDAEALLLIDDQQAEIVKFHVAREQTVRADDDVDFAGFEVGESFLLLLLGAEAAEHFDAHGKGGESAAKRFVVLEGEHGGGREHGDLLGIGDAP